MAITLGFLFILPVVLGFVQHSMRQSSAGTILEVVSGLLSGLGAIFCFVTTILAGIAVRGPARIYPAPLIATMAALLMMLHAFVGIILRITEKFSLWRKGKRGG